MVSLTLIVEDQLSESVARKMLQEFNAGYQVGNTLRWDKEKIRIRVNAINMSAHGSAFFVLTDQDTYDRCPPDAISELSTPIHQNLLYRFAVMEVESWVMAHRTAISRYLSVPLSRIPLDTDAIETPKEYLINIARRSRSRKIREDIVPRQNSTSKVGPDYNGRLIDFISRHWDVRVASQSSQSLQRAFTRLEDFAPEL